MQTTVIEKPMLFSAPMVRAILEGRKTQTRRVVKFNPGPGGYNADGYNTVTDHAIVRVPWTPASILALIKCPHPVGSRIWVRETWFPEVSHNHGVDACDCADITIRYAADNEVLFFSEYFIEENSDDWVLPKAALKGRNVTPLFMPRWASRITLEVTDVRVQRLQEISEEDAIAEGAERLIVGHWCHREAFAALWNSINGPDAWEQNPWVWAYTFRRVTITPDPESEKSDE